MYHCGATGWSRLMGMEGGCAEHDLPVPRGVLWPGTHKMLPNPRTTVNLLPVHHEGEHGNRCG